MSGAIKDEHLDLLVSNKKTDETGLNDAVRNVKDLKEAVAIIMEFKELLEVQDKIIINIVAKQAEI